MSLRRRVAAVLFTVCLLTGATQVAHAVEQRTPAECAAELDCTLADIDAMTMAERLEFLRGMQEGHGAELGVPDRWRNIEGVISFFLDRNLGKPGSWVSYVDAGILEGIERGIAIARGQTGDFGNPGSAKWATYVTGVRDGSFATRAEHDRAWSEAEQASTEHGNAVAERHGQYATGTEQRFYQFSEVYRWSLRNRPFVLDLLATYGPLIDPELAELRTPFYDWFTDVREFEPTYQGSEMSYGVAKPEPVTGLTGMSGLFLAYADELFDEYRAGR